ncbi:MAG: DNA polymerase I [Epsilonproteobacteria bacterium]|nr:DNA polymerase I [Campylobacterota bacterium]NPA89508.1 DNA polymerase I [Campylobacterota bacterium]
MGKFELPFSIPLKLEEFRAPENPLLKVRKELEELGIKAIFKRLERLEKEKRGEEKGGKESRDENTPQGRGGENGIGIEVEIVTSPRRGWRILEEIPPKEVVGFDIETTDLENGELVGFSLAFEEGKAFYFPVAHSYPEVGEQFPLEEGIKFISHLFQNFPIVGHNLKFDFKTLHRKYGIEIPVPAGDTMVLGWLLEPEGSHSLETLSQRYLNYTPTKFTQLVKKGESFARVKIEQGAQYGGEDAYITWKLYHTLFPKLWKGVLWDWEKVELPLVKLLTQMELTGIQVDLEYLQKLEKRVKKEISQIQENIFQLVGKEFNLNSTKQLQQILFGDLGLKPIKKTKTGYSTNEEVLKKLEKAHPIIPLLLKYRRFTKLLNTYIHPLLKFGEENGGKVYTTFIQTGTATGRLSSKNPNLQNIPVEEEVNIRNAFISNWNLVSLDYSQIELRLLAHYSQDPYLMEAFKRDKDIHLETARKLFPENPRKFRSIAKSINFGLIYGMGAKKLSETIGVSPKEAKKFIEEYFRHFSRVKEFIGKVHEEVRQRGYIETLLHRRRFFDFNRATGALLAAYLREAVNSIFQGGTADVIKKAMVDISHYPISGRLLLQIHDELLFELPRLREAVILKMEMEKTIPLRIPLKVEIKRGKRWGSLRKLHRLSPWELGWAFRHYRNGRRWRFGRGSGIARDIFQLHRKNRHRLATGTSPIGENGKPVRLVKFLRLDGNWDIVELLTDEVETLKELGYNPKFPTPIEEKRYWKKRGREKGLKL